MDLERYWGYSPMRVGKDTKYSVTAGGAIKLEYQETARVRWLMATGDHPELVEMVNTVKTQLTGSPGGAFYINEFGAVLVPNGEGGGCFYAGDYRAILEFREGDLFVSPVAPVGIRAGDPWPGPRVGIRYTLNASCDDIRFELVDGRRTEQVYLSDQRGPSAAMRTAGLVAATKGRSGGQFYVNECRELFAPVQSGGAYRYLYIGNLDGQAWFDPPARDVTGGGSPPRSVDTLETVGPL